MSKVPSQSHKVVSCPGCHSSNTNKTWTVSSAQAAQHFVRDYQLPERHQTLRTHIESLWIADEASLMQCDDCGLMFAFPFVGGDVAYYNLAYVGTPSYPQDKWEFRESLKALASIDEAKLESLRVLEVGAGDGAFVRQLLARGFDARQIAALEYNDTSLANLRALGVSAHAKDFTQASFDQEFDYVFMFQVLEHMDRLDQVFESISANLKVNGQAFIAVPNPDRINFNEASDSLKDMPPNHISRWRPETFRRIADRHGLQLSSHAFEPASLKSFVAQDLGYFYLRRSMVPGSLAAASYHRRLPLFGAAPRYAVAAAYALRRLPLWLSVLPKLSQYGTSLWVCLSKKPR